jgi:hypothetical protein
MELRKPIALVALILAVISLVSVFVKPMTVGAGVVGADQIKDGAVTENKLADGAVTANKIGSNAVGNTQLADNAVVSSKIAAGAVTSAKILDGTISGADIADGAIDNTKLADNAVTGSKIASGAVGNTALADNAVTVNKIVNGVVTLAKLAAEVLARMPVLPLASENLADNAVTSAKMAIKIQDGKDNVSGTSTTITFSTAFPGVPTVVATLAGEITNENIAISIANVTVANFTVRLRINGAEVAAPGENIYWIAVYTP